jgi:hypothetical protein
MVPSTAHILMLVYNTILLLVVGIVFIHYSGLDKNCWMCMKWTIDNNTKYVDTNTISLPMMVLCWNAVSHLHSLFASLIAAESLEKLAIATIGGFFSCGFSVSTIVYVDSRLVDFRSSVQLATIILAYGFIGWCQFMRINGTSSDSSAGIKRFEILRGHELFWIYYAVAIVIMSQTYALNSYSRDLAFSWISLMVNVGISILCVAVDRSIEDQSPSSDVAALKKTGSRDTDTSDAASSVETAKIQGTWLVLFLAFVTNIIPIYSVDFVDNTRSSNMYDVGQICAILYLAIPLLLLIRYRDSNGKVTILRCLVDIFVRTIVTAAMLVDLLRVVSV